MIVRLDIYIPGTSMREIEPLCVPFLLCAAVPLSLFSHLWPLHQRVFDDSTSKQADTCPSLLLNADLPLILLGLISLLPELTRTTKQLYKDP